MMTRGGDNCDHNRYIKILKQNILTKIIEDFT